MNVFDPDVWLASLGPRALGDFVARVLGVLQAQDPDFVQCLAIWRRAKTVRFTAALPDGPRVHRDVGIHVALEDADVQLLRQALDRAARGALVFEQAWAHAEGEADRLTGWGARLGMGSLLVRGVRGEIEIGLTRRQGLLVPGGLPVGAPFPFGLPPDEGFIAHLWEGQLYLIGSFAGIVAEEMAAVNTAPVSLGLAPVTTGLLLIGLRIPGLTPGWGDLPFSLAIMAPEERRLAPPEADGSRQLLFALVDRADSRTAAVRPLHVSPAWSAELERLVAGQQNAAGYAIDHYARDLAAAQRRWPSPDDMVGDFTVVETLPAS